MGGFPLPDLSKKGLGHGFNYLEAGCLKVLTAILEDCHPVTFSDGGVGLCHAPGTKGPVKRGVLEFIEELPKGEEGDEEGLEVGGFKGSEIDEVRVGAVFHDSTDAILSDGKGMCKRVNPLGPVVNCWAMC